MADVNREIGQRIKGIRELCELSIKELAEKIGITSELLESYESGNVDIPVSVIHNVSSELSIDMTELLTGEQAKLSVYAVIRKDKGVFVERRKAYGYKALASNFTNRDMEPFLITIEPKPEDEPYSLNSHSGQEFHYCLEGSFKIKIDKHEITINEGDSIYFDSTHKHGMKALNGKQAKELVIIGLPKSV